MAPTRGASVEFSGPGSLCQIRAENCVLVAQEVAEIPDASGDPGHRRSRRDPPAQPPRRTVGQLSGECRLNRENRGYNHFNLERHRTGRQTYKRNRYCRVATACNQRPAGASASEPSRDLE